MKEIISSVMCLSFVGGLYEIAVDGYLKHNVWYTAGGYYGSCWRKEWEYTGKVSEGYVRSILTEAQWAELTSNGIIECNIKR